MTGRTIYIVDDNQEFLDSAVWLLEGEGYMVEPFSEPENLLRTLKQAKQSDIQASCMLMDVRMPEMSGLDLHDRLNDCDVNVPIVYMTGHGDISLAVEAMKKGAVTFLEKPLDQNELDKALELAFEKAAQQSIESDTDDDTGELETRLALLTPRERDVADGVVAGKLNKIIAYDLGISIKTVELHRSRVMAKMQASNAADLVKMVVSGRTH